MHGTVHFVFFLFSELPTHNLLVEGPVFSNGKSFMRVKREGNHLQLRQASSARSCSVESSKRGRTAEVVGKRFSLATPVSTNECYPHDNRRLVDKALMPRKYAYGCFYGPRTEHLWNSYGSPKCHPKRATPAGRTKSCKAC